MALFSDHDCMLGRSPRNNTTTHLSRSTGSQAKQGGRSCTCRNQGLIVASIQPARTGLLFQWEDVLFENAHVSLSRLRTPYPFFLCHIMPIAGVRRAPLWSYSS